MFTATSGAVAIEVAFSKTFCYLFTLCSYWVRVNMKNFSRSPAIAALLMAGFCASSSAASAKAPEWSYAYEDNGFTTTVRVSACYEDDTKSNVSLSWYGSRNGATISADASCGCGEGIKINDDTTITPKSFADLIKKGIATDLKTYVCVPEE